MLYTKKQMEEEVKRRREEDLRYDGIWREFDAIHQTLGRLERDVDRLKRIIDDYKLEREAQCCECNDDLQTPKTRL